MHVRSRTLYAAAALLTALFVATGWWVSQAQGYTLTDHRGGAFTADSLEGGWSLVFAGFTHCPDICPDTLVRLNLLDKALRERELEVRTVFVSVDPERDTPERLAGYVTYFNEGFTGVTGPKVELDRFVAALGIGYVKVPGAGGDYTVDHSAALVLVDPDGRVAEYFMPPHDVAGLATRIANRVR